MGVPITRQSDYYGLDVPEPEPAPSAEKLAELLRPAAMWEGPAKVERR